MSRFETFRRARRPHDEDAEHEGYEEEVLEKGSNLKILGVIGLPAAIVLVAGIYVFAGGILGFEKKATPPQLNDLPSIGQVIQAEGPLRPSYQQLIDEDAPDFSFVDPSGAARRLSDYKGQVVVLTFWASWCPPCVQEMPDIEAVYREERANGLVVLGISLDEDATSARKFLQERGITFPSMMDLGSTATDLYPVLSIPTSFFIDREGKLRAIQIGAMTKVVLKAKVARIM